MAKESSESDAPRRKLNVENLRKLLRLYTFVLPQKWTFALGLLFLVLSSLTNLAFPMFLGDMFDAAGKEATGEIDRLAYILFGIFAATAIFSYFRIYTFAIVTQNTLARLRQATYNHLIKLPMSFFMSRRVGELNSRISADIALLQETFTTTLAQFLRQVITIIGGIALLTYISPKLTGFMLLIVPVVTLLAVFFGRYIRSFSKKMQSKVAESNVIVEETLNGIDTVKSFSNEHYENRRYRSKTNEVIDIGLKGARWRGAFTSFIIITMFGSIVAVIWYGIHLMQQGEILSSGDLFKFILYSVFIASSIGGMAELFTKIQKAIGATENLLEILDEKPEPVKARVIPPESRISGKVEVQDVDFVYPSRPDVQVLDKINIDIPQGKQVALVGPSGSGKSTITKLLLRFYNPNKGQILVDGKDASTWDLHVYRSQFAVVPQEVFLFGGTIRENIAYGNPDAAEEELVEAAKKSYAWEFIKRFPEEMDTMVGDRGVQLSGGQRQRIAIARAILKNPAILILDEATSSLDSESEKLVQKALQSLMKNRTSLVIAHRLSTIRNADKIFVLQEGKIAESGTHNQLLNSGSGEYARLIRLQTGEEVAERVE
ncbi:MAG: ATP-binding cassette domain-containing protein [Bacteroidales bacterium]|nr:ATP-binding cassette domain-containing protein [Bacteroidales bacterium]MCF8332827.1 ATP-binding cassette domain-containing protein [Bacteroidales bacterium]